MARRSRQLELPVPKSWGGNRPGAGRPPAPGRPKMGHDRRADHDARHPVLITLRAARGVPSLRSLTLFAAVRDSIARTDGSLFRVLHFSVQQDHVHAIVEAEDSPDNLVSGNSGPRHPDRPRHQAGSERPQGLGRRVTTRKRADHAARSSPCDRLCAAQLPKTSARAGWHRSAQLRSVVRRLGAEHLGVAPSVRHRPRHLEPGSLHSAGAGQASSTFGKRRAVRIVAETHKCGFKMARYRVQPVFCLVGLMGMDERSPNPKASHLRARARAVHQQSPIHERRALA